MKTHHIYPAFGLSALRSCVLRRGRALAVVMAFLTLTAACSSSSSPSEPVVLVDDSVSSEPLPRVLMLLQQDPDLIAPVPEVMHTQTMANSGLQVSYTEKSLTALAPAVGIERQWMYMQECLQQISVAPLVLVREGHAEPFTLADDVVRNESIMAVEIKSVPIASASTLYGAVIQVSVDDFDGSLGTPAFNLRSIMGRHLWLSASLPERDYPFECARQQP